MWVMWVWRHNNDVVGGPNPLRVFDFDATFIPDVMRKLTPKTQAEVLVLLIAPWRSVLIHLRGMNPTP